MEFSRVTLCVLFALAFMLSTTEAKKKCKQGEVRCFVNPCDGATCPGFEGAICKPNYCGGCNAEFFIEGAKVNCKRKGKRRMRCPKACGFNYEPVCGSDDKTYDNLCLFRNAKCENKELYLKKRMACDQCIKVCGFRKRPVCGSDGKTYDNFCLFRKARCENKDLNLKMAKPVACDKEYKCPRVCTLEYRPVCGSDGVLYDNKCKLQNARFCQKKDIRIVGKRRCSGNEEAEEP